MMNKIYKITDPANVPFCLRKESIFYILKKNSEVISENADTDALIQKLVLPSMQSPCGLLREQSCDLISRFKIKNEDLLIEILKLDFTLVSLLEMFSRMKKREI